MITSHVILHPFITTHIIIPSLTPELITHHTITPSASLTSPFLYSSHHLFIKPPVFIHSHHFYHNHHPTPPRSSDHDAPQHTGPSRCGVLPSHSFEIAPRERVSGAEACGSPPEESSPSARASSALYEPGERRGCKALPEELSQTSPDNYPSPPAPNTTPRHQPSAFKASSPDDSPPAQPPPCHTTPKLPLATDRLIPRTYHTPTSYAHSQPFHSL